MTESKTSSKTPDPRNLAADIRSACELQKETEEKLTPFIATGWNTDGTHAFRHIACNRLSATYKNGQFELFFFGLVKTVSFNSAKEALEYVEEVEKHLGK